MSRIPAGALHHNTLNSILPILSAKKLPPFVPAFNPLSLGSLNIWFAGDVGLTSSSWTNQSTSGLSGSVTAFSGMTIVNVNGLPAAHFDIYGNGNFSINVGSYNRSMFCVFKTDTNLTSGNRINITSEVYLNRNGGWSITTAGLPASNTFFFDNYTQTPNISSIYGVTTDTTNLIVAGTSWDYTSTSPNIYMYFNNLIPAAWGSLKALNDATASRGAFIGSVLGLYPPATTAWTLCEILVYSRSLTPAEGVQVTNYLKSKWGVV